MYSLLFGFLRQVTRWLGLRWIVLALGFLPIILIDLSYRAGVREQLMYTSGKEVAARVVRGEHRPDNRLLRYRIDLEWTGADGARLSAKELPVSREVWDTLFVNDRPVRETLDIRYLPSDPAERPFIVEGKTLEPVSPLLKAWEALLFILPWSLACFGLSAFLHYRHANAPVRFAEYTRIPTLPRRVVVPRPPRVPLFAGQPWGDLILDRRVSKLASHLAKRAAAEVKEVAPGSIAAASGIEPGFLVLTSKPVDPFVPETERFAQGKVHMEFGNVRSGERIRLTTSGYPHGMELKSTLRVILDGLGSGHTIGQAAELLLDGDPEIARSIAAKLKATKPWFGKRDTVFDALEGTALAIAGQPKGVAAMIAPALERRDGLLSDRKFSSLFLLATVLGREAEGAAASEVRARLADLVTLAPNSPAVRLHVERTGGELPPPKASRAGQQFPINYVLKNHDPAGWRPGNDKDVSLRAALQELATDQVLLLITLGEYRTNGYYSKLMYELAAAYSVLGSHIPTIHVITEAKTGKSNNPLLMGERHAAGGGLPFTILHDPKGTVQEAVEAAGSPVAFMIDRDGKITGDDDFISGQGLWRGLAAAGIALG
jgi:hypothetical protein